MRASPFLILSNEQGEEYFSSFPEHVYVRTMIALIIRCIHCFFARSLPLLCHRVLCSDVGDITLFNLWDDAADGDRSSVASSPPSTGSSSSSSDSSEMMMMNTLLIPRRTNFTPLPPLPSTPLSVPLRTAPPCTTGEKSPPRLIALLCVWRVAPRPLLSIARL